ncbi:MAG: UDP-3-O-acyl-N-acetylglucosamine deacetylase [Cyanobacteria bacterium P01_H01_bin.130]
MATTLARPITCTGVGLHSGAPVITTLRPSSDPSQGRYFVRTDLAEADPIPARVSQVGGTMLSTELVAPAGPERGTIRTVEHLLAALVSHGVSAVRIEVDGPEVPLLDGSAAEWSRAIASAGVTTIESAIESASDSADGAMLSPLSQPLWIYDGDAFVAALPAPSLRFSYGIEFAEAPIGNQWHSWSPVHFGADGDDFLRTVGEARTFGLARQVDQLRQAGLIQGGSLENALVCDEERWLNPPLRFENEPVRHKILDLVGDLSLIGTIPQAHYVAFKASHRLHVALAKAIAGSWSPKMAAPVA